MTLPMNFCLNEPTKTRTVYGEFLYEALVGVLEKNTYIPIYLDASCEKEKYCGKVKGILIKKGKELLFDCELYIKDQNKLDLLLTPLIVGKTIPIGKGMKMMIFIKEIKGFMIITKEFNEKEDVR